MGILEIFLIGVGLAMDAFAVSICKGLSMTKIKPKNILKIGFYFGLFQALMPLIGYTLGAQFQERVINIDHWIAFILLGSIGINMLKEAFVNDEEFQNDNLDFKEMIVLSLATSIDALAVGITFAFLEINIWIAITIIGITTLILSITGVKIGNIFGAKYEKLSKVLGGIILITIGIKILLEHLGII